MNPTSHSFHPAPDKFHRKISIFLLTYPKSRCSNPSIHISLDQHADEDRLVTKGVSSIVTTAKSLISIDNAVSMGTIVFPEDHIISLFSSIIRPLTEFHVPTFSKPYEHRFTMSNFELAGDRFASKTKRSITPEVLTFSNLAERVQATFMSTKPQTVVTRHIVPI